MYLRVNQSLGYQGGASPASPVAYVCYSTETIVVALSMRIIWHKDEFRMRMRMVK